MKKALIVATIALLAALVVADRTDSATWTQVLLGAAALAAAAAAVALDVRDQWRQQETETGGDN